MDGLKQNILIFLVIILVANIFAYPRFYRPSLKNEVPTKKALENYDDFGLDQSISDYPDNQVCIVFNQEFLLLTLITNICTNGAIKVLYLSFDKFLLAVESRDLSQTDKSYIRVSSFPS